MPLLPCSHPLRTLPEVFSQLLDYYGKQHWWPAETPDEIVIGAILTQNTNWGNVTKALDQMKAVEACTLEAVRNMEIPLLESLIRPSGFFRQKATRLQNIARLLSESPVERMAPDTFRKLLLEQHGIGPETADSILLYVYRLPFFVIDAYTRRICSRMGILPEKADYEVYRACFESVMGNLMGMEDRIYIFQEFHALIVKHAKDVCKKQPDCEHCILGRK